MKIEEFGRTAAGELAHLITLEDGGLRCRISTYGGALVSLEVPDREGKPVDVVLGFEKLADYEVQTAFMGALIGRYANRIGQGRFCLGGEVYTLRQNDGENHLHGGAGFDKRIWRAEVIENGVRLHLASPHMDEGYPGKLAVTVDYVLRGGALEIGYCAVSDRDTVCSLTNHAYFNLNGHDDGLVGSHVLRLFAERYTPVGDAGAIPTGEIGAVCGTPMDFTRAKEIGADWDETFAQICYGGGFDHNWVVDGKVGSLRPAAAVYAPESGVHMRVETTSPGMQFYSGNHMKDLPAGKDGAVYGRRCGFCLETQFYPDGPNRPEFPSPVLRAGERWEHKTVFSFR